MYCLDSAFTWAHHTGWDQANRYSEIRLPVGQLCVQRVIRERDIAVLVTGSFTCTFICLFLSAVLSIFFWFCTTELQTYHRFIWCVIIMIIIFRRISEGPGFWDNQIQLHKFRKRAIKKMAQQITSKVTVWKRNTVVALPCSVCVWVIVRSHCL